MYLELDHFRSVIIEKKRHKTYKVLERELCVNRWYLWQIIHDENYQPPARICAKLGIAKYEPAPVCLVHGIVHCYDCSKEIVKPKPKTRNRAYKSLYDWPVHLLRAAIENREEIRS